MKFFLKTKLTRYIFPILRFISKSFLGRYLYVGYNRYDKVLSFGTYSYNPYSENKNILNIGSGGLIIPKAVNMDLAAQSNFYRIIQGKPFKDFIPINIEDEQTYINHLLPNHFDYIYCAHTLEHVTLSSISKLFKNLSKSIKKTGTFRVIVPDCKKYFTYCKYLYKKDLLDSTKILRIKEMFYGPAKLILSKEKTIDILESTNDALTFFETLKSNTDMILKNKPSIKFGPEMHLQYLTEETLEKIANKNNFNYCSLGPNQSAVNYFQDELMFDHTDRDFSTYLEFWLK